MKIVLFCENQYAIDILLPLQEYVWEHKTPCHEVLWYIHAPKIQNFPLESSVEWTSSIQDVYDFSPEAIFVPGNIVPYYLPGVKIQVFHGYAAEKKDHWIIRHYFDTYFTQGPYFTSHFEALARQHGTFEVRETGWPKQDWIFKHLHDYDAQREKMLAQHGRSRIVLYAPTFSPKLSSLPHMKTALEQLLEQRDVVLLMKFHPLTRPDWAEEYKEWAKTQPHAVYVDKSENITTCQLMSDIMLSDTSSAVYEFLLLDRPVVTLRTIAKDIYWENIDEPSQLLSAFDHALNDGQSRQRRRWVVENYDPHLDGLVCERMIHQAEDYIRRHGVPSERKLNPWRKYTSIKTFGRIKRH